MQKKYSKPDIQIDDVHFINQIIYHSITNDEFIRKIRSVIDLDIFKAKGKKFIMQIIFNYFDEYKCAPKDNFYDIFQEHEDSISTDLYNKAMDAIGIIKEFTGSNYEYILNKIHDAIRHWRLEEGAVEFASLIKQKKYDEAKTSILNAMKEPEEVDSLYFDYFSDKSYIQERLEKKTYKMKTSISGLNKAIGGLKPSWLINILGATKSGKSFFMLDMAIVAVLQGLNVAFISLEMNKEQVEIRFDQGIGFLSTNTNLKEKIEVMSESGGEWHKQKERVGSVYDINLVEKNRKKFKKISGKGGLKIMAFNRGQLNWMDIDSYLDEMELKDGFVADILIVDYLKIMKATAPNQSPKERISENCLGLKTIAGKRNVICISGMQGNRTAMQANTFQPHMVADDIDSIFHSDLILAICQNKKEEQDNKARIYVPMFRHGKQGAQIGTYRCLNIGQFAMGEYEVKDEFETQSKEITIGTDY